jgi:hypothetical protein
VEREDMKVTFTNNVQLESEGRGKGPKFVAGKTYDLEADQAQRWIRRDAAVLAEPIEDPFPEVEPAPKTRRAKKDEVDGKSDPADQSQGAAAAGEGPDNAGDSGLKAPHAVPHPSQSAPESGAALAEFKVATAPKSGPRTDSSADAPKPSLDAPKVGSKK